MRIEVTAEQVYSRSEHIRDFLKPLVSRPENLYIQYLPIKQETIITVCEKGSNIGTYDNYRFDTIANGFWAMYHERWKRFIKDKSEYYYLYRVYLHLYQINKAVRDELEFALLHCDPNEPDSAAHAEYKQGLHLHIECGNAPWPHGLVWPKAHIALNVGYHKQVLKDLNSLTEAIKVSVIMLKKQVLEQLL